MSSKIHKTAIIEDSVEIGENVEVGAYSVISGNVKIADNVKIKNHANITGNTEIGESTVIFPFASIGEEPQDLKYRGEESRTIIGKNNKIREHVTINAGTEGDNCETIIGDGCLLMIGAHIAHDCVVGNGVILANNAAIAGHVKVGDYAVIGGLAAVHQYVRIGKHAMIGGMSGIESDVIPFGNAYGERASLQGLNLVGLKRHNIERDKIQKIREAYKEIFSDSGQIFEDKLAEIEAKFKDVESVDEIINFIKTAEKRAVCQPKKS